MSAKRMPHSYRCNEQRKHKRDMARLGMIVRAMHRARAAIAKATGRAS